MYTMEGRNSFLSRLMVLMAFPIFGCYGILMKGLIFFRRDVRGRDFNSFNKKISDIVRRSHHQGLLVYPEGTRNTKATGMELRRGMLRYAFSEKMPVQVVISTNKEHVLSQRELKGTYGVKMVVGYSPVMQTKDYETFDAFFEAVNVLWRSEWKR